MWGGKLLLTLKVRTLRGCVACGELLLHAGEGGYSLSSEVSIAWSLMSGGRPGRTGVSLVRLFEREGKVCTFVREIFC